MKQDIRKLMLAVAAFMTLALTGCLQDEKDPAATSDVGKLTGSFYASGLGNIAVQIQNFVMGDSSWFAETSASAEINLADRGISATAMGAPLRSFICPSGDGTSVRQFTYLDGRNEMGKFSVKGIGTDAGSIVQAIRARVAPYQVGIYAGGTSIDLASGEPLQIPGSCSGMSIPLGAPVIAFKIDRPAAPSEALFRTEYRTIECGADAQGLKRRGTEVQKRTIRFLPDGTFDGGNWEAENMGNCVDDVVVQVTKGDIDFNAGASEISNFAAIALTQLLQEQLQMGCRTATVTSNKRTAKEIDTCGNVGIDASDAVTEVEAADNTDSRILACTNSTAANLVYFNNLLGDRLGLSTIGWTSGTATILRTLDNKVVSNDMGQEANRNQWRGTAINCGGGETYFVQCGKLPGAPALAGRASGTKWLSNPVMGYFVDESWFASVFNLCWFGSCKRVIGGTITELNPAYFTGTSVHSSSGTTVTRPKSANSWVNPLTFVPLVSSGLWTLPESSNFCIWQQRVMIANCPFNFDPSRVNTSWNPSYTYLHGIPTALDPGVGGGGSDAGRIYDMSRSQGRLTANVTLLWEDCNFKGCDYWYESAGPGTGVYIKQWQSAGYAPGTVILSAAAKEIRTAMCNDLNFQLNSSNMVPMAQAQLAEKTALHTQRQNELAAAQSALTTAQGAFNTASNEVLTLQGNVETAEDQVDTRTTQQQTAQTNYNLLPTPGNQTALNNANANLATAQANLTDAQTDLAAAVAIQTTAQTTQNNAQTAYNNAVTALSNAAAAKASAEAQLAAAQGAASSGLGRDLTPEERAALQSAYNGSCVTQNDTLSATEQPATRQTCIVNYNNPTMFAGLPALNNYCGAVFDRAGDGTLTFKVNDSGAGSNVITTLLNTEGVMLAHKATLVNQSTLAVTQRDFTEPLNCLRQEERYFSWPRVYYYYVCGGKGGCWLASATQYITITESTTRQWTGLSYNGGLWSNPSHGYRSAYGSWANYSQIPYPLY